MTAIAARCPLCYSSNCTSIAHCLASKRIAFCSSSRVEAASVAANSSGYWSAASLGRKVRQNAASHVSSRSRVSMIAPIHSGIWARAQRGRTPGMPALFIIPLQICAASAFRPIHLDLTLHLPALDKHGTHRTRAQNKRREEAWLVRFSAQLTDQLRGAQAHSCGRARLRLCRDAATVIAAAAALSRRYSSSRRRIHRFLSSWAIVARRRVCKSSACSVSSLNSGILSANCPVIFQHQGAFSQ